MAEPKRTVCAGVTKRGKPCAALACVGSTFCRHHRPERRPPGRPTKYTPETVAKIIRCLQAGNYRCVAATMGGIDDATFCRWMNEHSEFCEQVTRAEAYAEDLAVSALVTSKDDRMRLEFLARKFPKRWARQDKLQQEISGPGGGAVRIESVEHVPTERVLELAALARMRDDDGDCDVDNPE